MKRNKQSESSSSSPLADPEKIIIKKRKPHLLPNPKPISVPLDIVTEILSLLPLESVVRFKCVSKEIGSVICDPLFVKKYFVKYKKPAGSNSDQNYDYPDNNNNNTEKILWRSGKLRLIEPARFSLGPLHAVKVLDEFPEKLGGKVPVGAQDGLICTVDGSRENVFLWAPSIGYCRKLPEPIPCPPSLSNHPNYTNTSIISSAVAHSRCHAFGYDPVHNDYKILMITPTFRPNNPMITTAQVFSWKKNRWSIVEDPLRLSHHIVKYCRPFLGPVLCNGVVLHWQIKNNNIVAFNLSKEKFREVPAPDDKVFMGVLGVVRGNLCSICFEIDTKMLELWVMKDYGVKESWDVLGRITLPSGQISSILCVTQSGEKFFWSKPGSILKIYVSLVHG
ncbi:hypothetical protein Tsubulata_014585 [Turnera subulata]|uniref:F-box domain-containing protein n=1 Tax=Turnera subulata TaxID=218843 RepID=A0A9Q0JL66_9ROSI|nr:hypothetical protein Tsubulata_014585 [Turnera subulata]